MAEDILGEKWNVFYKRGREVGILSLIEEGSSTVNSWQWPELWANGKSGKVDLDGKTLGISMAMMPNLKRFTRPDR